MEMKFRARLHVTLNGGLQTALFETVAGGLTVLEQFAKALAKIKEFGNRDEDPIFRFQGAGAHYVIDLRKASGASLEECDEWGDVSREFAIRDLRHLSRLEADADAAGLKSQFDERYKRRDAA